ncbi:hypothetical protein ACNKHV_17495 [Shigella flexneri]
MANCAFHAVLRHYAGCSSARIQTTTHPMAVVDWINMFALAVNETRLLAGLAATAPMNGAWPGIIPAVLAYYDVYPAK